MTKRGHVYINGRIVPAHEAAVSPFDVGLLRGYAVFDLLQTIGGRPFQLHEHLVRFRESAAMLGLEVPIGDDEITGIIETLLGLNDFDESTVRMVLTGGESDDGMHFDPTTPTLVILTHPMFAVPAEFYSTGAKLITEEYRRELPQAKTTNYISWMRNHGRLEEAGALDVLYHADGYVSEAATASFYLVTDGRIHAPDEGVLRGTVGTAVLELAAVEYDIVYGPLSTQDVADADEAFITSSVRGVIPIVRIDDAIVGSGRVGPVSARLVGLCQDWMNEFSDSGRR
ncbi:MAG: aminotransferase class IV [Coriobacteriia bacterium]|nr:aminotransferase class IV [Coriobacteriia bacterium]